LAGLCCAGCAGAPTANLQTGEPASPPGSDAPQDGLPTLPTGAADPVVPRGVSLADNFQNGNQTILTSHNAVFTNGTGLDMGPAGKYKRGWAIWRWGAFQGTNLPRQVKTDITFHGGSQYWVLLSDYSKQRWQVLGANKTANATYSLNPGDGYLSPSKNFYVAIVVTDTYKLTLNTLDLVCDSDATPPGAPAGLTASNITPHSVRLNWTPPSDGDIQQYLLDSTPPITPDPSPLGSPPPADIPGLKAATQYQMTLRAQDWVGNIGPPSNTVTFTTKPNGPPVPDFTYNPLDVQKNVAITFDPGTTTDPDDPPSNLVCTWDWYNDGTDVETQPPGLHTIQHSFPNKGPETVKLTVSDGSTPAPFVTKSFTVGAQLETRDTDFSISGDPVSVLLANAEYSSGQLATVYSAGTGTKCRYFDGNQWFDVDISQFIGYNLDDLVVVGGKIYLAVTQRSGGGSGSDLNWAVYTSTGGAWTQFQSGTVTGHPLDAGAKLAVSSAGRMSLALGASLLPQFKYYPNTAFYIIHQKSDNTLLTYTVYSNDSETNDQNYDITYPQFTLQRSDTTTYCAYTEDVLDPNPSWPGDPNAVHGWPYYKLRMATVTDGGGSKTNLYDVYLGSQVVVNPVGMQSSKDPSDDTKMYWAVLDDQGQIYYGDSFGSSNTNSQKFVPSPAATNLLGAGLASDNQCLVYYSAVDSGSIAHLYGFQSSGGTTYDPLPGVGSVDKGFGSWYHGSGSDGLYVIANEPRDGEITGRLMVNGSVAQTDQVAEPIQSLPTGDKSVAFITPAGGLEVLNQQNVPIAYRHSAPTVGGQFTNSQLGLDCWATPRAAASGPAAGEILVSSAYAGSTLVINDFPSGSSTGTALGSFVDSADVICSMAYNATANLTGIAYSGGGGQNVLFRSWNGTTLSSATTVYTGSATLINMVLKVRPDGQWGVAWDDLSNNVRMAETSSGAWQAPNTLSTSSLNFGVGSLGMEYASNGDAGLAVERDSGTTGLYFGLKPLGSGTATWELAQATQGFDVASINVHFLFGTAPTILYNKGGVTLAQKNGGTWTASGLAFYISGSPLVSVMDSAGTLAIAGKDNLTGKSAVCFLSQ
jgi:hypothetical protein